MEFVGNLVFFPLDIVCIAGEVLVEGIGYIASILFTMVRHIAAYQPLFWAQTNLGVAEHDSIHVSATITPRDTARHRSKGRRTLSTTPRTRTGRSNERFSNTFAHCVEDRYDDISLRPTIDSKSIGDMAPSIVARSGR
jgi:hypothetical protein